MSKTVLFVHLCSSNVLIYNPGCIIVKVVSLIYSSDKTFLFHCSCLYYLETEYLEILNEKKP